MIRLKYTKRFDKEHKMQKIITLKTSYNYAHLFLCLNSKFQGQNSQKKWNEFSGNTYMYTLCPKYQRSFNKLSSAVKDELRLQPGQFYIQRSSKRPKFPEK